MHRHTKKHSSVRGGGPGAGLAPGVYQGYNRPSPKPFRIVGDSFISETIPLEDVPRELILNAIGNEKGVELKNYLLNIYFDKEKKSEYTNSGYAFSWRLWDEIEIIKDELNKLENDGEVLKKCFIWLGGAEKNVELKFLKKAFMEASSGLFLYIFKLCLGERSEERYNELLNGEFLDYTKKNSANKVPKRKSFRGLADAILEINDDLKKKRPLSDNEQKVSNKFLAIKQGLLRLGAKPRTHLGMLVHPENAQFIPKKGGRKTRRRRL